MIRTFPTYTLFQVANLCPMNLLGFEYDILLSSQRNSTGFESRLSAAENIEGPLMFVARTITTLRDNNLHHLPILADETRPGNFNILETGRVAWHQ
jgi:hypothetical protein